MADLQLTDEELAALLAEVPPQHPRNGTEIAALLGESVPPTPTSASLPPAAAATAPAESSGSQDLGDYSWLRAIDLVPEHRQLILRYPAIGLKKHPQHGVVLMAAYLEDVKRRVRRNLKLGDQMFFHADALEVTEPETKALGCRLVIKTMRHQVGMRIRFWQNEPHGDAPGRSGTYEVRDSGLQLLKGIKR